MNLAVAGMKILTINFTGITGGCRYLVKLHKRKFRFENIF